MGHPGQEPNCFGFKSVLETDERNDATKASKPKRVKISQVISFQIFLFDEIKNGRETFKEQCRTLNRVSEEFHPYPHPVPLNISRPAQIPSAVGVARVHNARARHSPLSVLQGFGSPVNQHPPDRIPRQQVNFVPI